MKQPSSELDYRAHVKPHGGSKKGRDNRHCPMVIKDFARKWAIDNIGDGNESYFIHNPNAGARFTARVFAPCIPLICKKFPKESKKYFEGRMWNAAKLIAERVHKMFYCNDGHRRGRGISNEHPRHRSFLPHRAK